MNDDTCRCHDEKCGVRERCQRWIDRQNAGPRVVHAMTLKPGYFPHERPCPSAIGDFPELEDE